MTDKHDAPLPDPTPLATGGVIHHPDAIRDAAARIRTFLAESGVGDGILIGTENFHFDTADLIVVLDALDACTVPTGFIELPAPMSEQEYEELKAKWRATHMAARHNIKVEWTGPPADNKTFIENVRRWIRTGPGGRATGA